MVTDVDINRAWVPLDPGATRIVYLTPSYRAVHRLRAYGVPREQIEFTGFPLPPRAPGRTGPAGPAPQPRRPARAARPQAGLPRSDPKGDPPLPGRPAGDQEERPPLLTYTVGGAGAQADLARPLLEGLRR